MSFKAIGRNLGYHYTIVSHLVWKQEQAISAMERPRSDIPPVTTLREDRQLKMICSPRTLQYKSSAEKTVVTKSAHKHLTVRNCLKVAWLKEEESSNIPCWETTINMHVWQGVWPDDTGIWGPGGKFTGQKKVDSYFTLLTLHTRLETEEHSLYPQEQ